MANVTFKAGEYAERTKKLYDSLMGVYANYSREEAESLGETYANIRSEDKIKMAFIGQYSAGKSTIISALTGNNAIKIDADIATSKVSNYEWSSILLSDTPGLYTGKTEHDEMTNAAIAESDLLVYCITSDLFNECTRNDFKRLAYEKEYQSKMFLVINKMSNENLPYDTLVENYTETINKTLGDEHSIRDFRHFFFDAADYKDGKSDNDSDLIAESHFEEFIQELNRFIQNKGEIGKMCTPLDLMKDSIESVLSTMETSETLKAQRELYNQIANEIRIIERKFKRDCRAEIKNSANKFIQMGNELARKIGVEDPKFGELEFEEFSEKINTKLLEHIDELYNNYMNEAADKLSQILESETAKYYFRHASQSLGGNVGNVKEVNLNGVRNGVDVLNNVTAQIAGRVLDAAKISSGTKSISLLKLSGSDLHKAVKSVGKALGYKFKPFGALKLTKNIAKVATWIGPAMVVAGAAADLAGAAATRKRDREIEKCQEEIRTQFQDIADDFTNNWIEQITESETNFSTALNNIQNGLAEMDKKVEGNNELRDRLLAVKKDLIALESEIKKG